VTTTAACSCRARIWRGSTNQAMEVGGILSVAEDDLWQRGRLDREWLQRLHHAREEAESIWLHLNVILKGSGEPPKET
jgi:hypothetical protein